MANRRGKGEGSIFKRADGTWCSRIEIGRDANGKRIRKDIYGKTKKAVSDELMRQQTLKAGGTLVADTQKNMTDYLNWWLDNAAALTVRPKTLEWYRQVCATHIKPKLGTVKLQKLAPVHVQTVIAEMARDKKSPRMRQIVYALLHRSLVVAVKQGMVTRNVVEAVDRPTVPKHEITPMSAEQAGKFLAEAESDRLFAMYALALGTGMRQGELFGLEWADIDLKAGTLQVRRTLVDIKGVFTTNEPKTDSGRRLIELPEFCVAALWNHKAQLLAEGLAANPRVFTTPEGKPLSRSSVTHASFRHILKRAGITGIRFHDLRHTTASLLLAAGTHPKVVQERLGHSNISMTMDIYSHCLPSMQKEAASKLDGLLKKPTG